MQNAELKVIENDLVPVYETDKGIKVVNGRELHQALQSGQDFSTWVKKRLAECDAEENKDYDLFHNSVEQVSGTKHRIEYIIKLDIAKEMAMLEKNEKGKQIRKYFIAVEEKYKQGIVDHSKLSPELQMFLKMGEAMAQQELEQKRMAKEIEEVKQVQNVITETFQKTSDVEDFQKWANNMLAQIAESPKFDKGYGRSKNYSLAHTESYERLKQKRNCRLDDRVQKAIGRAIEEKPDIKKDELRKYNKLYIIANDKDLRPVYELVIKEMMIAYCVSTKEKE